MSDRLSNVPAHVVEEWRLSSVSNARYDALRIVEENPGHTARELERITGHRKLNARLSELHRMGLVREARIRYCTVSNRQAVEWVAVPGAVPIPLERKPTARERIVALESQVARLQRELDSANQKLWDAMKRVGELSKKQQQSYLDFGGDL